ncbi:hypothetical protein ACC688_05650 [Rhizobium ruizarguesonis]
MPGISAQDCVQSGEKLGDAEWLAKIVVGWRENRAPDRFLVTQVAGVAVMARCEGDRSDLDEPNHTSG